MTEKRRGTFLWSKTTWHRLRQLAAAADLSMTEFLRRLIEELWDKREARQ